jgi:hypothetical protein
MVVVVGIPEGYSSRAGSARAQQTDGSSRAEEDVEICPQARQEGGWQMVFLN